MNRTPSDSAIREAIARYLSSIAIPSFDLAAIHSRRGVSTSAKPVSFFKSRRALTAFAAAALFLAILPTMPAVVAQVERALHAFTVVNGRPVPLEVRDVTLDQARADMPFEVIAPAAIPAGWRLAIRELRSPSTPLDTRLMFEYRDGHQGLPALTIMESSSRGNPSGNLLLTQTNGTGPPNVPPPPPSKAEPNNGMYATTQIVGKNGRVEKEIYRIHPITWVRGTRVVFLNTPGRLTSAQVAAIRAAMTR
jgi:hypothetical protein